MTMSRRAFLRGLGASLTLAAVGCGPEGRNASTGKPGPLPAGGAGLTGRVLRPGDDGWDAARANYNARFSVQPSAIVFASSPDDVANAVRWARENGVALRPRSGRHSYEAFSLVEGGLVLDVSPLSGVAYDAATGLARVGAGALTGDVWSTLAASGVMVPTGSCISLGMAGMTLGGGVGFSGRKYGLTCDSVQGIDLVTAEGQPVHASADQNPDLFWALRGGGGGNLGVVTGFQLRTYPADRVATYYLEWPLADFEAVMAFWQGWAPYTDPGLFATLSIGRGAVSSSGQFYGDGAALQNRIADLMRVGSASGPHIQELSSLDAARQFGDFGHNPVRFKSTSGYLAGPLPGSALQAIVQRIQAAPSEHARVQFDAFGGAINAPAPAATAFAHRAAIADVQIITSWASDAEAAASLDWVAQTRAALDAHFTGAYVNYVDADLPDFADHYYGSNLAQLAQVKRAWDPSGFFAFPQAIPTTSGQG